MSGWMLAGFLFVLTLEGYRCEEKNVTAEDVAANLLRARALAEVLYNKIYLLSNTTEAAAQKILSDGTVEESEELRELKALQGLTSGSPEERRRSGRCWAVKKRLDLIRGTVEDNVRDCLNRATAPLTKPYYRVSDLYTRLTNINAKNLTAQCLTEECKVNAPEMINNHVLRYEKEVASMSDQMKNIEYEVNLGMTMCVEVVQTYKFLHTDITNKLDACIKGTLPPSTESTSG